MGCDQLVEGKCVLVGVAPPASLCAHCASDGTGLFRATLAAHKAKQELRARLSARTGMSGLQDRGADIADSAKVASATSAGPVGQGEAPAFFPCDRFALDVDEEFCAVCRSNPALKQQLAPRRGMVRRRSVPCIHRGEQVGEVEAKCCGGRTKIVPTFRCTQKAFATEITESRESQDERAQRRTLTDLSDRSKDLSLQVALRVSSVPSVVQPVLVTERECMRCGEYQGPILDKNVQPTDRGSTACVSWESLWQAHKGQTALILACGPSVLLPGEEPSPDTVDPRLLVKRWNHRDRREHREQQTSSEGNSEEVRDSSHSGSCSVASMPSVVQAFPLADVVISTNWAWKWYEDIIDYQVSYDPTPCLGWRPAHIKLLTPIRPRATQAVLEKANVYCFFPSCDYGGIAQGKALPCSRNSGYAALAFAAYTGCSRILVLGMDFGPKEDPSSEAPPFGLAQGRELVERQERRRMHFYHEAAFDVQRRVKSFGRQKERVQADLTKLLVAVRATGATVESLSPRSELDWGYYGERGSFDSPALANGPAGQAFPA